MTPSRQVSGEKHGPKHDTDALFVLLPDFHQSAYFTKNSATLPVRHTVVAVLNKLNVQNHD